MAEFLRKTVEAELAGERQGHAERDAALVQAVRTVVDTLRALSNGPSQLGDLADMPEVATPKLGAG